MRGAVKGNGCLNKLRIFWRFLKEFYTDMDLFSLEEDGGDQLFITQTPKDKKDERMEIVEDGQNDRFLGVPFNDFSSLCGSLVNKVCGELPEYEDISDGRWQL